MLIIKDELGHVWGRTGDAHLAEALAAYLFRTGHTPTIEKDRP